MRHFALAQQFKKNPLVKAFPKPPLFKAFPKPPLFKAFPKPPLFKGGQGGILLTLLLTLAAQACPPDFEPLTAKLLSDLPSYANRVMQRSRSGPDYLTYVQLAGLAEFEPLGRAEDDGETRQVFFTTLEQQFTGDRPLTRQHYHWLFLTPTDTGWAMVYLFTRFGEGDPEAEPMPPRETSSGIIGQAISLWLRDCEAGAVRQWPAPPDLNIPLHRDAGV